MVTVALIIVSAFLSAATAAVASPNGDSKILEKCSSNEDCAAGLYCGSCHVDFQGSRCLRSTSTNTFKLLNNSMPFNKYSYLTTHNSFAIIRGKNHTRVPRVTFFNQEDSITQQLYVPAIKALKEIEVFLSANPSEIVTLILEDYVEAPNGLSRIFKASGLMKYWFPVSSMPQDSQDWPLVKHMIAKNHRLIVFTSQRHKQESEGIAYQWNYMVENQYGNDGMVDGICPKRAESAPLNEKSKTLVLVNHFRSIPIKKVTCKDNSEDLMNMLGTCYGVAGNRWANFVAVDYYKRSEGGGSFQAVDMLNGKQLCGCDDVHSCVVRLFISAWLLHYMKAQKESNKFKA
ncbi:hypothetical protein L6164_001914 [Bauhinia variegata]|uniref:Uncharacterized protein n=1 Tax=Bauhinia variegata TaxID=167791 RepID=A0ACB9QBL7_BAUVA|nr:hypothetical protein L6164_001914 [Bauhinia variegata]